MAETAIVWSRQEVHAVLRSTAWLLLLSNVLWAGWFALFCRLDGEQVEMLATGPVGLEVDPDTPSQVRVVYHREFFTNSRYWVYREFNNNNLSAEELVQQRPKGATSIVRATPAWLYSRFLHTPAGISSEYWGEVSASVGWPVRILWCSWRMENTGWLTTRDTGIRVDVPPTPIARGTAWAREPFSTAIPFRPVLAGQLLYGAMCIVAVVLVRSYWRARHQQADWPIERLSEPIM